MSPDSKLVSFHELAPYEEWSAESLSDLLERLGSCSPFYGWVFRGQEDATWGLAPKIARLPALIDRVNIWQIVNTQERAVFSTGGINRESPEPQVFGQYIDYLKFVQEHLEHQIRDVEQRLTAKWKLKAIQFLVTQPRNDVEWLAIAQHHGLATRLLDWTESPLVATYFALERDVDCDAAIFALSTTFGTATANEDLLQKLDDRARTPDIILKITPPSIVGRIVRQKGLFTTQRHFWADVKNAIKTRAAAGLLRMIRIPRSSRQRIFRELMSLGIDRAVLFPDLDGLAHHLNYVESSIDFLRNSDFEGTMLDGLLQEVNERRNRLPAADLDRLNKWCSESENC